jgi:hypothetical protein
MIVAAITITLVICAVFSVFAQRAAYHNGFRDWALWAKEGEHYPSKPAASWGGWKPLRNRMGRRAP